MHSRDKIAAAAAEQLRGGQFEESEVGEEDDSGSSGDEEIEC
jgi:hypothetical protein